MTRYVSRLLLMVAAMSVAALPVAAQANTRATASVYSVPMMSYSGLLCTMQSGGCLLPLRQPAPVTEVPVPPAEATAPAAVKKSSSLLPILLGLGLLLGGALAFSGGGGNGGSNQSNGAN